MALRSAYWIALAGPALFAAGCVAPFIPLMVQGAEWAGKAVAGGAETATMVKHGNDQNPQETEVIEQTKFDDSDFDSSSYKNPRNADKCNELVLFTPAIIQFRTDRAGSTQWRELGLGGSPDAPRWMVLAKLAGPDPKAAVAAPADGWASANNLDHMEFNPPLKTASAAGDDSFMAYAPAVALAGVERDELLSLTLDFGPVVGTFKYNDRTFKYATLDQLPCFPIAE